MTGSLKDKAVSGVAWSAIDRFSSLGITFVFSILIARILSPEDFGVIAMLNIFLAISSSFIDSGFGSALVRKQDRTQEDFSTVFYFNIIVALLFYGILWISAPAIANFYHTPILVNVTRIVSLTLPLKALSGIQSAQLSIKLDFKTRAIISFITTISTGIFGLFLAYKGYGVWALVIQQVLSSAVGTILLWVFVHWIPQLVFSWKSFKELFSFGSKLLASGLLDTIYNNLYTIVIGKFFSSAQLGLYSKANTFANFPSSNLTGVMQSVTYPILSTIQDDTDRLSSSYKKFINLSSYVVFPLMIGLAATADPLVRWVLTDKWEGMIYLLQILCFALMWYPVHAINLNLLQVLGRSDYFLKLEIYKKILGAAILCVTIPMGIVAMCYGRIVSSILCLVLNTHYTNKIIGYGFWPQMKDLSHILIHSLIMGVLVWFAMKLVPGNCAKVFMGMGAGITYYYVASKLFKFEEFDTLVGIIKERFNKK